MLLTTPPAPLPLQPPSLETGVTFTPFANDEGVHTLLGRKGPGDDEVPWVRAHKTLGASCQAVALVLSRFESYGVVFQETVAKAKVLETTGTPQGGGPERIARRARLHVVWSLPFPYKDRDGIVAYEARAAEAPASGFEILWRDDARASDPPTEGVRIARIQGRTHLAPKTVASEAGCVTTYEYFGELGGDFAGWVKRAAWKKQPLRYFEALEKALEKVITAPEASAKP